MPSISSPGSDLAAIQQKVRRLTRSPSTAQLSDDELNNYINTFVIYDFPEHLRMFNLHTVFDFWCNPYQDVYPTDTISFGSATSNPLYNFQNLYITINPPLYIAGYQSFYSQSREQFYGIYPQTNNIQSIGVAGDGTTLQFSGVIPILSNGAGAFPFPANSPGACLLKNNVLFSSVDVNGNGLSMVDQPIIDMTTGNPTIYGNLYLPSNLPSAPVEGTAPYVSPGTGVDSTNYVNYTTGEFVVTFPVAPGSGIPINSQTIPATTTLPQAMLYYDNTFTLRPVPDQPYQIQFEAYARPTYLMETNQAPQLQEWWQYIAYGAAKKVLEDRLDMDTVALILPEFNKQENLVLRRTLTQLSNQRVATIYTEQVGLSAGLGGYWGTGGSSF